MTPHEIDLLARKWCDGTITEEERARFEAWYRSFDDSVLEIDSDEGEVPLKQRLYRWVAEQGGIPDGQPVRRLGWLRYTTVAAMLLAAFLVFWNHQNGFNDRPWIAHVEAEAVDGVHREILPDGTIIWLRPGARLHYKKPFDRRDVVLTGEALFEVAKLPERPFRVSVGEYEATVKGTSFNIRQAENGKDMELVVLTGEVAVRKRETVAPFADLVAEPTHEVVLQPNQRLKTEAGLTLEAPPVETVDLPHDNEYTQGTAYNMWLDDTPFDEVVRRIRAKFGVTIQTDDARYRDCRISSNLSDQSLAYTVEVVAAILGADYEIKGKQILLKGGGCL